MHAVGPDIFLQLPCDLLSGRLRRQLKVQSQDHSGLGFNTQISFAVKIFSAKGCLDSFASAVSSRILAYTQQLSCLCCQHDRIIVKSRSHISIIRTAETAGLMPVVQSQPVRKMKPVLQSREPPHCSSSTRKI